MTTIAEHKLNVIRQVDELTEESLCEVEKLIAQLKANQSTRKLKEVSKFDLIRSKDLRHLLKNYPVSNRTVAEIDAQINALRNEWN